jgi:hypothetical protein
MVPAEGNEDTRAVRIERCTLSFNPQSFDELCKEDKIRKKELAKMPSVAHRRGEFP